MLARTLRRLRAWWATSPRARRVPVAPVPLTFAVLATGVPLAGNTPGTAMWWALLALLVLGAALGIWAGWLILTGRDW